MAQSHWAPVGARIKQRLEQLTKSQDDLVAAVRQAGLKSFDKTKLSRSLSGERQLTSEEVALIADAIALDPYFVVTGKHPAYEPRVAARHEYVDGEHVADWSECLRLVQSVSSAYSQAELVGDGRLEQIRKELKAPNGTPSSYAPGRELAERLRRRWEDSEYRDIVLELPAFLEADLGIELAIVDGTDTKRARAQAFSVLGNAVIVTVQTGSWYSAVYAVMHEVGHLLFDDLYLHDPEQSLDSGDSERFANGFAADFLMPKGGMPGFSTEDRVDFATRAWVCGVGSDAIARRARSTRTSLHLLPSQVELNRLQAEQYGLPSVEQRRAFWRTPRFPDRLVAAHSEGVEKGALSPDCLAWMLGVPTDELRPEPTVSDEEAVDELLALL